nr:MAG: hypothetical protein [Bacteriophage sp.]
MLWTFNPESKVQFLMGEHNTLLTLNFLIVMKKVISLIKRGAKAYFRQAAKAYAWTPTGTIPVGI